jgi:putative transposase
MGQSLSQLYTHIVFSTKNRVPFLKDKPLRERLHAFIAGICDNQESPSLITGGVEDHVHILCRLSKNIAVVVLVREIKRESSKWVKENAPELAEFHWQAGYGSFSVSPSHVNALEEYIKNQEEHHRKESFQDEFRRLLQKYGIQYDERYVWD